MKSTRDILFLENKIHKRNSLGSRKAGFLCEKSVKTHPSIFESKIEKNFLFPLGKNRLKKIVDRKCGSQMNIIQNEDKSFFAAKVLNDRR